MAERHRILRLLFLMACFLGASSCYDQHELPTRLMLLIISKKLCQRAAAELLESLSQLAAESSLPALPEYSTHLTQRTLEVMRRFVKDQGIAIRSDLR